MSEATLRMRTCYVPSPITYCVASSYITTNILTSPRLSPCQASSAWPSWTSTCTTATGRRWEGEGVVKGWRTQYGMGAREGILSRSQACD